MNQSEIRAEKYWNERYDKEGQIWGEAPSRAVWIAIQLFGCAGSNHILIPGCGYGRLSRLFSMSGFAVAGVDISGTAVEMARQLDTSGVYYQASALKMDFDKLPYDAVFAFNILHLMPENDRKAMIIECRRKLKDGGLAFFTVFSERENDFGQGREIEKNTFETRPGRPAHYFTEEDLNDHFKGFELVESGMIEDPEDHGGQAHRHLLRYICIRV